jgi:hypothetical protein
MFSFDERFDARETAREALRPAPASAWPPRAPALRLAHRSRQRRGNRRRRPRLSDQRPTMSRRRRRIAMKD